MSVYVLTANGEVLKYPYTLTDMRFDNPTVSFPTDISDELAADFGVFPVSEVTPPSFNPETERLLWVNPEFTNGSWLQRWSVEQIPAAELAERLAAWREHTVITPFQGKVALFNAGLLDDVESLIASSSTDSVTKIAWTNAIEWRRKSPMIVALATALNLSETEVDALFKDAASVTA